MRRRRSYGRRRRSRSRRGNRRVRVRRGRPIRIGYRM